MTEELFQNLEKTISIWRWDPKHWVLQVDDYKIDARVRVWGFHREGPSSGVNYFMRQYFIPQKKMRWVCRELEIGFKPKPRTEKQKAVTRKNASKLIPFKSTKAKV